MRGGIFRELDNVLTVSGIFLPTSKVRRVAIKAGKKLIYNLNFYISNNNPTIKFYLWIMRSSGVWIMDHWA